MICNALLYNKIIIYCVYNNSNPDVMMEAYSQVDASPIFFFIYLVLTLYFVSNIVRLYSMYLFVLHVFVQKMYCIVCVCVCVCVLL